MPRLCPLALAISLLFLARPVAAGGSAVFEAGDGTERGRVSLEFDGDRLRMTPEADKASGQNYVVFRDGRMYSVAINDGETMVFETSQMMKMMGGAMARQMAVDTGLDDIAAYHGLNATGRSETHAGITGEVYTVDYTTRAGKREKTELVLARNATLVEMSTAMTAFSEMMAKAIGQAQDSTPGAKALTEEFQRRKLGVLRVEDSFRLTKLDTATPKAARFALPAEPMVMPEMPALPAGLFGAGAAEAAAGVDADGNPIGEVVDDKVERQKQRVQQRAEQEADQATDQVVDKALNKAFDKLFGR
jgi:hypothetical protein